MTLHQKLLSEITSPFTGRSSALDLSLLGAVLGLLVIGLVMVSSASMEVAGSLYSNPFYILIKQGLFVFAGLLLMGIMMMVPVKTVEKYSWVSLFGGLGLLLVVLVVGREINGSVRWIPLGFFNLQASEAAKLMIVIYLAAYLVRRLDEVRTRWTGFLKPMAILSVSSVLLLMEPDFGALVVLMGASMGMIFLAGARLWQFIILIMLLVGFIVALIVFEPYRMARLASYMDPWANAFGSGYQLTQSLIAFGRGEWFGEGLGNSLQKLFYLPEAHTDFVFAVLAEEFGVLGAVSVLTLILFIAWRAMQIGFRAETKKLLFHGYVAYGIGLLFGSQALINIGVNTGLLPTKGLALPLISYGGSSLLINCLAFGLLLRIDYERRQYNVETEKKSRGAS
ncbi:putative lipid II flippase FtsW [Endozoicomonas numazuensis]|uniref:putative lipid II flippase FtsW n=1 Tax=Endozoicomonas numazuensis TaxID=1137799 RepID=UPI0006916F77|nr:putative lipid II flippase FtsW [Endozoicomonas numazuensis]